MSDLQYLDSRFGSDAPAPTPQRAGQATMVEQARAIAEVRAAVMIAMDRPRDRTAAMVEMREVCGILSLAERAFFRVPRGNEHVNGESIHLARELARCWGNLAFGVKELARDDIKGQSELLAFAWDLQTNARSEITFIVPHTRGRGKRLTGTQEIYENNASFAGRRLRETIFAVLPVWFKAEASEICHQTLKSGGGKPFIQQLTDLRLSFDSIGITAAQLERKRGRRIDDFTPEDTGALRIVYGSIKRGEVTVAEEFPPDGTQPKPPAGGKLDALESLANPEGHREGNDATTAETSPAAPEGEEDAFGLKPLPKEVEDKMREWARARVEQSNPQPAQQQERSATDGRGPAPAGEPGTTGSLPATRAGGSARPFATTDTAPSGGDGDSGDNHTKDGAGPTATTTASRSDLLNPEPENLAVPLPAHTTAEQLDHFARQMLHMIDEKPKTVQRLAMIRMQNERGIALLKAVNVERYDEVQAALAQKPGRAA